MFPIHALTDLNHISNTWSTVNYDNDNHVLVPIEDYSYKYNKCAEKVSGSFNEGIKSIQRVQNPFLYGQFMLKQEEYRSRGIDFEIKELFHDTAEAKIESIVTDNLNWRLTYRGKYGKGVSFSPSPRYANLFSSRHNGTDRAMIITDVLVGKTEYGTYEQPVPLDGDTTVDYDFDVYVKFYDDEFYPKYIVNYQSAHQEYRW